MSDFEGIDPIFGEDMSPIADYRAQANQALFDHLSGIEDPQECLLAYRDLMALGGTDYAAVLLDLAASALKED